jgi:hypothetical protein
MTEAEWLTTTHFEGMARVVYARSQRRRCRLLAVAYCRLITPRLGDRRSQRAIEVAEQDADGAVGNESLVAAHKDAVAVVDERSSNPAVIAAVIDATVGLEGGAADSTQQTLRIGMESVAQYVTLPHPYQAALYIGGAINSLNKWNSTHPTLIRFSGPSNEARASLFRDIFGNPFRPVAFDPAWRTSTAVALAQQMYDSRDFSLMPILGDALQDAGCESADMLDHCRGDGPHVRGCWVVDLVLGKS